MCLCFSIGVCPDSATTEPVSATTDPDSATTDPTDPTGSGGNAVNVNAENENAVDPTVVGGLLGR